VDILRLTYITSISVLTDIFHRRKAIAVKYNEDGDPAVELKSLQV
jgi:hypothetical protein